MKTIKSLLLLLLIPVIGKSQVYLNETQEYIESQWGVEFTPSELNEDHYMFCAQSQEEDIAFCYVFSVNKETCDQVFIFTEDKGFAEGTIQYLNDKQLIITSNKWMVERYDGSFARCTFSISKSGQYTFKFSN